MTFEELQKELDAIDMIEDDDMWWEAEYALLHDYCRERNFCLSEAEDERLQSRGIDFRDFCEYQLAKMKDVDYSNEYDLPENTGPKL